MNSRLGGWVGSCPGSGIGSVGRPGGGGGGGWWTDEATGAGVELLLGGGALPPMRPRALRAFSRSRGLPDDAGAGGGLCSSACRGGGGARTAATAAGGWGVGGWGVTELRAIRAARAPDPSRESSDTFGVATGLAAGGGGGGATATC